jgi:hypothetical protein
MDEIGGHYFKWNKSDRQMLHVLLFVEAVKADLTAIK